MTIFPWHDRAARLSEEDLVINDLDPRFAPFLRELLTWMRRQRLDPFLIWGRRSKERQKDLVRGGTSKRLDSLHIDGLASDVVDRTLWWGASLGGEREKLKVDPTAMPSLKLRRMDAHWAAIGRYCKMTGLGWGGLWKNPYDPAHIEWKEGAALLADQSRLEDSFEADTETTLDEFTPELPLPAPIRAAQRKRPRRQALALLPCFAPLALWLARLFGARNE